jgi:hypothetical protein
VNQRDDTIAIKSIGGITTVHGMDGNDFFYVNVEAAANAADFYTRSSLPPRQPPTRICSTRCSAAQMRMASARSSTCTARAIPIGTTVNLAGQGDALINVLDNGAPDDGVDTLIVNGAERVAGVANQPNDTFLLRRDLVALLNGVGRRPVRSTTSSA